MKRTYKVCGGGTVALTESQLETGYAMHDDGTVVRLSEPTKRRGTERRQMMFGALLDHQRRFNARRATLGRVQARAATAQMPECTRAPRAAGTPRGSRRAGASSSTSSADPGDADPEPSSLRVCGGCGEPLIDYAPQARYHDDACRMRARRLAAKPHRPSWSEAEVISLALAIEPFPVIEQIMQEPPQGAGKARGLKGRPWRVHIPKTPVSRRWMMPAASGAAA